MDETRDSDTGSDAMLDETRDSDTGSDAMLGGLSEADFTELRRSEIAVEGPGEALQEVGLSGKERRLPFFIRDRATGPLMDLGAAQRTSACRARGFLSPADIARLQACAEVAKPLVGMLSRDGQARRTSATGEKAIWHTHYLHTDGFIQHEWPELCARLGALAQQVDAESGWGLLDTLPLGGALAGPGAAAAEGTVNVRVCEYHEYFSAGALEQRRHYDAGSLVTIGIMLSDPQRDFLGGAFQTLEPDGTMRTHEYELGDAIVFVSHKYHSVAPITSGRRNVLITEIWKGPERSCAHRCLDPRADCSFTARDSRAETAQLPTSHEE
jgi:hypothetical protein